MENPSWIDDFPSCKAPQMVRGDSTASHVWWAAYESMTWGIPGISTGRSGQDFLARFAFVGIFIVENVLHAIHFEFEVDQMVLPAVAPLPYVPSRPSWWHTKPKKMGPQNGGFPKSPFFCRDNDRRPSNCGAKFSMSNVKLFCTSKSISWMPRRQNPMGPKG